MMGPQICFYGNMANYGIPKLSPLPLLIWSTDGCQPQNIQNLVFQIGLLIYFAIKLLILDRNFSVNIVHLDKTVDLILLDLYFGFLKSNF